MAASSGIRLAPSYPRGWLVRLIRAISPIYVSLGLGFSGIEPLHPERAAAAYDGFFGKRNRLIIAFRHPYGDEPQLLSYYLLSRLRKDAAAAGRPLGTTLSGNTTSGPPVSRRPHALFIHGYEVPRWGGSFIRWLLPRMGALPVHHAKTDSTGLSRIRKAIRSGPYPVALSPEGQVSYTPRSVPRIEQGTARLALMCAEELARANKEGVVENSGTGTEVLILPVSFRYIPSARSRRSAERILRAIEKVVGIETPDPRSGQSVSAAARLARATELAVTMAEKFYGQEGSGALKERLSRLIDRALEKGEKILGIPSAAGSSPIERVYRIRQAGWDRIFLENAEPLSRLSPLKRRLLDRGAGEAWYAMRHMEFVDFTWYFDPAPLADDASPELVAEQIQNVYDLVSRLIGGALSDRKLVRPVKALIHFGEPISVTAAPVLDEHAATGNGKRKAEAALITERLLRAYEAAAGELWGSPGRT